MIRRNQYSVLDTEYISEEGVKENGSGAFTEKVPFEILSCHKPPHYMPQSEHRYIHVLSAWLRTNTAKLRINTVSNSYKLYKLKIISRSFQRVHPNTPQPSFYRERDCQKNDWKDGGVSNTHLQTSKAQPGLCAYYALLLATKTVDETLYSAPCHNAPRVHQGGRQVGEAQRAQCVVGHGDAIDSRTQSCAHCPRGKSGVVLSSTHVLTMSSGTRGFSTLQSGDRLASCNALRNLNGNSPEPMKRVQWRLAWFLPESIFQTEKNVIPLGC